MTQLYAINKKLTSNIYKQVERKRMEKNHANISQRKAGVTILISDQVDFRENHYTASGLM